MYATCIHCHASLGANGAIEAFPVGRRLAFDARRGRLWAVCEACGRWNLSPLDERWEAIEACERLFRDTRVRVSTGNVGLARLREGLELVRIGEPLRPEFAAWRYGRQYARRRWRAAARGALTVGAVGGIVAAGVLVPSVAVMGIVAAFATVPAIAANRIDRPLARLGRRGLANCDVRRMDLDNARLATAERGGPEHHEGWRLLVGHRFGAVALDGDDALAALRRLLPLLNGRGAGDGTVHDAVARVAAFDGRDAFFAHAARLAERESGVWRRDLLARFSTESTDGFGLGEIMESAVPDNPGALRAMAPDLRLALEMAVHEETERQALDGELAALEAAWQEAEEIAEIADTLFLPESVGDWLRRHPG